MKERTNPDLCTYVKAGNSNFDQEYFCCYTCEATVCNVCVKTCHAEHDVSWKFPFNLPFVCGCGRKGEKNCISLLNKQSGM